MKRNNRQLEMFSLSFLDIISCGFGAVVLLVLISNNAEAPGGKDTAIMQGLINQYLALQAGMDALSGDLRTTKNDAKAADILEKRLSKTRQDLQQQAAAAQTRLQQLTQEKQALSRLQAAAKQALSRLQAAAKQASIRPSGASIRDEEVGGIPVDSDYVVFIIDTSGSMQSFWRQVVKEVENVIRIHPKVKGFQILNDNGTHLISAYQGKWIPDTPRRRDSAIDLLSSWSSFSNSSPVEGLEVALKNYVKRGEKVSIYIFGDEYSGGSFDPVIATLDRLNTAPGSGQPIARVHGVGFFTNGPTRRHFATLMREVTRRHNGSFVALPR